MRGGRSLSGLHLRDQRLRSARFEEQVTLEGFDFGASAKLPAAQIRDLAALRWLQAGESVILYGPVGVGKSHVAQALGHLAVRHGAGVRFLKTAVRWRTWPGATPTAPGTNGSGPVEGHVDRIKMIKRQMYGRANPDLLRKRVLLAD